MCKYNYVRLCDIVGVQVELVNLLDLQMLQSSAHSDDSIDSMGENDLRGTTSFL